LAITSLFKSKAPEPLKIKTGNYWRALIFTCVLTSYFALAYFFLSPLLNNGDYLRVTQSLIFIPPYSDLTDSYFKVTPSFYLTLSTSAWVLQLSVALSLLLSQICWTLNAHFLLLSFIYILGAALYANSQSSKISILITLFIAPIFFSIFLKSVYEEGVLLVLMPWLLSSINTYLKNGKVLGLMICFSLLLLTKYQLILLVPAILFFAIKYGPKGRAGFLKINALIFVLVFSVGVSSYNKQSSSTGQANSYNRLFNGLGWSIQGIGDWPANQYSERENYFINNRTSLQAQSNSTEFIENERLWGTSFWPKGLELMTSGDDARWQSIEKLLTFKVMATYFWAHPQELGHYFFNSSRIFLESNYTLKYLQIANPSSASAEFSGFSNVFRKVIMLFYLAALILFFLSRKNGGQLIGILTILCAPLAVILGDGFFEFEKHMMPYFIALPLLFILIPRVAPKIIPPFGEKN
jgi:hypothetical protein